MQYKKAPEQLVLYLTAQVLSGLLLKRAVRGSLRVYKPDLTCQEEHLPRQTLLIPGKLNASLRSL